MTDCLSPRKGIAKSNEKAHQDPIEVLKLTPEAGSSDFVPFESFVPPTVERKRKRFEQRELNQKMH